MDLQSLSAQALSEIQAATALDALDQIRVNYLGKKGELTALLKSLGNLPAAERKTAGQDINLAKQAVQSAIEARKSELQQAELQAKLARESVDVTLAGPRPAGGWFASSDTHHATHRDLVLATRLQCC